MKNRFRKVLSIGIIGLLAGCATLLSGRQASDRAFPPLEVRGNWKGNARIIVTWCKQKKLPITLSILSEGKVEGAIGDARLKNGRIRRNTNALLRTLGKKSHYRIVGDLEGSLIAGEAIQRKSISIPFRLENGCILGGLHTSGTAFGGKKSMKLSASGMVLKPDLPSDFTP